MSGSYIDHLIWQSILGPELPFNPDTAIYKYWRALRAQSPPMLLGAPVSYETQTDAGIQQAFSSGAVICWSPDQGASLAHDE